MSNELLSMVANAEREIKSFYKAVLATYGPTLAGIAISDWLDVMNSLESLPDNTIRYWRRVTIFAADRLATRVCSMPPAR